jgi:serine/threonine protein kinase
MNLGGNNKVNIILLRGSFAIVRSAVNKKTGERVAIKIIDRYYPFNEQILTYLECHLKKMTSKP